MSLTSAKKPAVPENVSAGRLQHFDVGHISADIVVDAAATVRNIPVSVDDNDFSGGVQALQAAASLRPQSDTSDNHYFLSHLRYSLIRWIGYTAALPSWRYQPVLTASQDPQGITLKAVNYKSESNEKKPRGQNSSRQYISFIQTKLHAGLFYFFVSAPK